MMTIEPIVKKSLAIKVCESLQKHIFENNLAPGDKLPSEKELMAGFAVGRGSVREAIRALEIMGIVETKAGEGSFVREPSAQALVIPIIFNLALHDMRLEDLAEVRCILEQAAAKLAAERASREDIQRLEDLVEEIENELDKEPKGEITDLDLEFHRRLIESTKNPILLRLIYMWDIFFHKENLMMNKIPLSVFYKYAATHRPLLEAIKAKNSVRAQEWVEKHMKFWLDGEFRRSREKDE